MIDKEQVFLKLNTKASIMRGKPILLKDLLEVSTTQKEIKEKIEELVFQVEDKNCDNIIISIISIISLINQSIPDVSLVLLGEAEILIRFVDDDIKGDKFKLVRVVLVCFLLFIGSMVAIVNFHSDVDMKVAHKTIYKLITNVETERPLLLQIPYSIGIGIGISVFFNHAFTKKINKEPSPLEVEIFNYQEEIDDYIKGN